MLPNSSWPIRSCLWEFHTIPKWDWSKRRSYNWSTDLPHRVSPSSKVFMNRVVFLAVLKPYFIKKKEVNCTSASHCATLHRLEKTAAGSERAVNPNRILDRILGHKPNGLLRRHCATGYGKNTYQHITWPCRLTSSSVTKTMFYATKCFFLAYLWQTLLFTTPQVFFRAQETHFTSKRMIYFTSKSNTF